MPNEVKIVAVIVTYNIKERLVAAIQSVLAQTIQPTKIIVVANAADNETQAELKANNLLANPLVEYQQLGETIGGAGQVTAGIRLAQQQEFDWLSLSDGNMTLASDYLAELVTGIKKYPNVKCFTGTVASATGEIDTDFRAKLVDEDSSSYQLVAPSEYKHDFIPDIFALAGSFINSDVINQIGLPVANFFSWQINVDYSTKIKQVTKVINVSGALATYNSQRPNVGQKNNTLAESAEEIYSGMRNSFERMYTHPHSDSFTKQLDKNSRFLPR